MTVLGTPYRLGTTPYIWPADLLTNVRHLGLLVDDVELVLFESGDCSNPPDKNLLSKSSFSGVLTLEVFGRDDFLSSRDLVAEVVNGRQ